MQSHCESVQLDVHQVVLGDAVSEVVGRLERLGPVGEPWRAEVPAEASGEIVAELVEVLLQPDDVDPVGEVVFGPASRSASKETDVSPHGSSRPS